MIGWFQIFEIRHVVCGGEIVFNRPAVWRKSTGDRLLRRNFTLLFWCTEQIGEKSSFYNQGILHGLNDYYWACDNGKWAVFKGRDGLSEDETPINQKQQIPKCVLHTQSEAISLDSLSDQIRRSLFHLLCASPPADSLIGDKCQVIVTTERKTWYYHSLLFHFHSNLLFFSSFSGQSQSSEGAAACRQSSAWWWATEPSVRRASWSATRPTNSRRSTCQRFSTTMRWRWWSVASPTLWACSTQLARRITIACDRSPTHRQTCSSSASPWSVPARSRTSKRRWITAGDVSEKLSFKLNYSNPLMAGQISIISVKRFAAQQLVS